MLSRRRFTATLGAAAVSPLLAATRLDGRATATAIEPPPARFFDRLPTLMEVAGVPGVGMGVVVGAALAWQRYEGLVDATGSAPIVADTLFPAASLGKPVFAYAALRLADLGRLDLDRPLKAYVPDHAPSDPRGDKVTARHVLSHCTGYRNWRNAADQALVPEFDPGSRFQYSGEGFYYLQRAIEKITGRGFEQFMEEQLFDPFGMRSSTYAWRADCDRRLVVGHSRGRPSRPPSRDVANRLLEYAGQLGRPLASFTHEEIVAAMADVSPTTSVLPNNLLPNAAGSLLTTVGDYAAFLGRVLAPSGHAAELSTATRQAMLSPHIRINSAISWGLGWGLESAEGREYLWHWGDNGPFKNFVLVHVASRSAIVVFTNGSNGLRIAEAIVAAASRHGHFAFDWL